MSALYRPMIISKKKFDRTFGARISNTYNFQAISFLIYDFSRKIGYLGEVFICKSYLI